MHTHIKYCNNYFNTSNTLNHSSWAQKRGPSVSYCVVSFIPVPRHIAHTSYNLQGSAGGGRPDLLREEGRTRRLGKRVVGAVAPKKQSSEYSCLPPNARKAQPQVAICMVYG